MKPETHERIARAMVRFGMTPPPHQGKNTSMTTPRFIDSKAGATVGEIFFLVEVVTGGESKWQIFSRPCHTNGSHTPMLHGYCGTTNDVARFARGMVRIKEVLKNGRARVEQIPPFDLPKALETMGYPELKGQI